MESHGNGHSPSNGHGPVESAKQQGSNPYADVVRGKPREIVEFEMNTDPYSNMLPGISNINAARTVGRGVSVGRRGRPVIMAISVFLLLVLLAPLILAVLSRLFA